MDNKTYFSGFILCLLIFFSVDKVLAQRAFEIAVFNESTSVPFSGVALRPLHPGVQIGTDIPWHESKNHKTYISLNLRYIFHKNLFRALSINLELGYDFKANFGMNLKTSVGVGYMHSFNVNKEYLFKNGRYTENKDRGNSRFVPSFSYGLGYRFKPDTFHSNEIFAKQQYWLEMPYSPGFIPLMSHANTMLGGKFFVD